MRTPKIKTPKKRKWYEREGIYSDVSHTEYNGAPNHIVRNSYLNDLDYCPAKVKDESKKETPSMLRGRAAHSLILEGLVAFDSEFAVAPTCDKRTKAGKEEYAKFEAENLNKTVISEEDYIRIIGMNAAVKSHPFAKQLLAEGVSEQTVVWQDEETGIWCRCRPDRVPAGHNILVDLKGTKDASEYGFDKAISTYRYYRQAAMYQEGISKVTGEQYEAFTFIGVEWEFPHRTIVRVLDKDYLGWGKHEFHELLRLEKKCRDNDYWPHYKDAGAGDCFMPAYLGI